MPNLDAAKKALRVNERRRVINDQWRGKLRVALYAVRDALKGGKKEEAQKAFMEATSVIDRAARRNIIHPNKAARKKSRLAAVISKLS